MIASARFLLAFLPAILFPLAISAQVVPPAAEPVGLRNGGVGTPFENPVFGPKHECSDIERQMVLLNPTVVAGEPVMFRLLLKTLKPEERTEFMAQLAYGTDVVVTVQPPGRAQPYMYVGPRTGTTVPTSVIEFSGFLSSRIDFRMVMDENTVTGAAFDIPGIYRVDVRMRCRSTGAEMEMQHLGTFQVTVQPGEADDAKALEILSDYKIYDALQARVSKLPTGMVLMNQNHQRQLERVVAEAPKARIRPHAMIVLADHHIQSGTFDQGLELLRAVQQDYTNTPHYDEALQLEMRLFRAKGDDEALSQTFLRIWQDPVMTVMLHPKSATWKRFVAPYMETVGTQWMLFEKPGPDPTGTGTAAGPRIRLSEEVQRMLDLPEFVSPDQLRSVPVPIERLTGGQPQQAPEGLAPR